MWRKLATQHTRKSGRPSRLNLSIRMLWSTKSNAFRKSKKRILTALRGCSSARSQRCTNSASASTVLRPCRDPYWELSSTSSKKSIIHGLAHRSRHLARIGVSDIGRRSFSILDGFGTFGIGQTSADFHEVGTCCSRKLALKIAQTGSARYAAPSFKTHPGIWSGPCALPGLMRCRMSNVCCTLMV